VLQHIMYSLNHAQRQRTCFARQGRSKIDKLENVIIKNITLYKLFCILIWKKRITDKLKYIYHNIFLDRPEVQDNYGHDSIYIY